MQLETMVKDKLAEFVKECGFKRYPEEACGLVYADSKGKPHFVECKNKSLEPQHNFLIEPEEYLKVSELGEVVACWHTHCEVPPVGSKADKQACKNTQVPWFIGSVYKKDGHCEECHEDILALENALVCRLSDYCTCDEDNCDCDDYVCFRYDWLNVNVDEIVAFTILDEDD